MSSSPGVKVTLQNSTKKELSDGNTAWTQSEGM